MNEKIQLKASHLPLTLPAGELIVFLSPAFVGSTAFAIRKTRLTNPEDFRDAESLKALADDHGNSPVHRPEEHGQTDADVLQYFAPGERAKYTRTPWFIADDESDGVLFASAEGQHAIFDRRYVELFDVDTLYRLPCGAFTDVPELEGDLLLMPCDIQLPPSPPLAAWAEQPAKAKKNGKK